MDIGSLQIIVFIATFLLMLAVGITNSYEDLKNNIFIIDRALAVSIILQLLIVPIIFFIFVNFVFDLETNVKIFLMVLALSPGAVVSTAFVSLCKGNVFLSIKMSAIMTLISIFSLPLILSFYVSKLALNNSNVSVNINLIIIQIFVLVVLPFFLGSFFNRNNFIQTNFLRIVRIFIKGSLLFVIILGLNYFTFKDLAIYLSIIPYMLTLISLLVVSSYVICKFSSIELKDQITIILETFMQNLAVVLIVTITVFSQVEKFLPYMIIWLFLQNLVGYIFYFMRKKIS
ncbi:bile acid:sodium symporter [Alphaproteobacteria bacterium]|nr:bile acid:sodium symporter [Alphaproteobacteria bacterium]MDB9824728.1 bile acid:sodium symporter [Alphaproteobacteria bacterium]